LSNAPQLRLELDQIARDEEAYFSTDALWNRAEEELAGIEERHRFTEVPGEVPPVPPELEAKLLELDRIGSEAMRLKRRIELHRSSPTAREAYSVPHFLPAVAAAVLPAAWIASSVTSRARRRARRSGSRCVRCGYDLRSTPGRCPECGTAPAGKEA
jgi:hypothetical protein